MNPKEHRWHTKVKHRFIMGGIVLIVTGMILACFGGENRVFLYVGTSIMLGGLGSHLYGMKDDD